MKKLISVVIATVGVLFVAGPASAGPVFDLTATTNLTQNNSGLGTFAPTSVLLGSIQLTQAAGMRIMAGATTLFGAADLANFQFNVGNLTLSSAGAAGVDFRAVLGPDGNVFNSFRLLFTTPMGVGGCDLLCITEFGRFATARDTVNIQFRTLTGAPVGGAPRLDLFAARFTFQRRDAPEPAALGLIALGLLARAAVSWRRRSS